MSLPIPFDAKFILRDGSDDYPFPIQATIGMKWNLNGKKFGFYDIWDKPVEESQQKILKVFWRYLGAI